MKCKRCGGAVIALFYSVVCERCDAPSPSGEVHRGYVIWRARPPGSTEYVFRYREGAACWRASAALTRFPIRGVLGSAPFVWRPSQGSVSGVELAEGVYEVYADPGYIPAPGRVHLEPAPPEPEA